MHTAVDGRGTHVCYWTSGQAMTMSSIIGDSVPPRVQSNSNMSTTLLSITTTSFLSTSFLLIRESCQPFFEDVFGMRVGGQRSAQEDRLPHCYSAKPHLLLLLYCNEIDVDNIVCIFNWSISSCLCFTGLQLADQGLV